MKSKKSLSFGYTQEYHLSFLKWMGRYCCCFMSAKQRKDQKQLEKNMKRRNNAGPKLADELDVINIVKTLRATKFLMNLALTPY